MLVIHMSHTIRRGCFAILLSSAILGATHRATAQTPTPPTNTWVGTGNANWSNVASWDPAAGAPSTGGSTTTVLQFNNSGSTTYTATNDLGNPFQLNGLILNSSSSGSTTITDLASNSLSFVTNVGGPFLLQNNTGSVTIGNTGTVNCAANPTFAGGGTGGVTISSPITFATGVTGLALNGYNTTTLSNASIALPSTGLTITGNGIGNLAVTGVLTGSPSAVTINTGSNNYVSGYVQLSGLNTYTAAGGVNLQSGILVLGGTGTATTGALGNANTLTISGGSLRTSASTTVFNPITMSGVDLIESSSATLNAMTLNGAISVGSGTSGLQVLGLGGLTINNVAAFNGATTLGIPSLVSGLLTLGGQTTSGTTSGTLLNTTGVTINTAFNSSAPGNLTLTNATTNSATRLNATAPITLNNGRITYLGGAGANSQTFGNITVNGMGAINVATGGTGTTLTFGTLTRSANATVAFRGPIVGTGGSATNVVATFANGPFTGLTPGSAPAIIPWATGFYSATSGNTITLNSLVTPDGNGVRVLNTGSGSDYAIQTAAGSGLTADQNNLLNFSAAGSTSAIANGTTLRVNSLVATGGNNTTIAGGPGSTLQVYSGAIVANTGTTITAPTLDFGSNTAYITPNSGLTVTSVITGTGGLVVSSNFSITGGLFLFAPNTFSGGITLNGTTTVKFTDDRNLGAASNGITFGGSTLQYFGSTPYTDARSMTVTPAGGVIASAGANSVPTIFNLSAANVSGTGPLVFNGGTVALTGTSGGTWNAIVSGGILQFTGDANFGSTTITLTGGILQPSVAGTLSKALQINASSTIDVGSLNETLSGVISTLGTTLPVGSPSTLIKAGVGGLTLTANSPFVGPLSVNAGTLTLNGANGALASATTATVNPGASMVLDNSGAGTNNNNRYRGPVTLAGGSFTTIGNSVGTTGTIGTLSTTAAGSVINLKPDAAASLTLTATNLNLAGGTLLVRGTALGSTGANTSKLLLSTPPTLLSGIIQGVVGDLDPVAGGGNFLVGYSSTNGLVQATTTPAAGGTIANPGNAVTDNVSASGPIPVGTTPTINSLTMTGGTSLTSSAANTLTLTSGMLVNQSGGSVSTIDGNTTIASGAGVPLVITAGGDLTVNGPLTSATGALAKLGVGNLTIASATTTAAPLVSGIVTVAAGSLTMTANNAIGALAGNGNVAITNGNTVTLNGSSASTTLFGSLTGAGTLTRTNTATGTFTLAGPVSIANLESDAGTLSLQTSTPAGTSIIIGGNGSASSATLSVAPGVTVSGPVEFQTPGGSAGRSLISSVGNVAGQAPVTLSGTVTIDSSVTLVLSSANSTTNMTGQVTGLGGILLGGGSSGAGATLNLTNSTNNFSGGVTLEAQGAAGIVTLGIGGSGVLGSGNLVITPASNSTVVGGGGYLQALNGPQTVSSGVTVSPSGTGGTVLGLVGTNALTLNTISAPLANLTIDNRSSNGSVMTINTYNSTGGLAGLDSLNIGFGGPTGNVNALPPTSFPANIVRIGTLNNDGATNVVTGVLQITGTATSAGGLITVSKLGTLGGGGTINRSTEIAGTVSPGIGASGTMSLTFPMTWDAGGSFAFSYSNTSTPVAGTNYNTISSSSTLDISGLTTTAPFTIAINRVGGPLVTVPQTYVLGTFTAGGVNTGAGFNAADFAFSGTPPNVIPAISIDGTGSEVLLTLTNANTWTGTTSGNWSVGSNWLSGVAPTSSADTPLTFGATSHAAMNNDIAGSFTLNSMTFLSGSPVYTLGGNGLNFATSSGGTPPSIVQKSANSVTLNNAITLSNDLTVSGSGNLTLGGTVSGPGAMNVTGGGTLTLAGSNSYAGGTNVTFGTVQVSSDAALGTGNVTGGPAGTVAYTGSTTASRTFNMNTGTISVAGGQTLNLSGATVTSAYLDGAGSFATGPSAATLIAVTILPSVTLTSNNAGDRFTNVDNGGKLNVAAGLTAGVKFTGLTNEGSGTITVGQDAQVNVNNFQSYGTLTINPGSFNGTSGNVTQVTNTGTSPLYFNGGSRTFISTVAQVSNQNAGIDLHGNDAIVAGGLFVNNGFVYDSVGSGTHRVVADYGALVKGAGFYQPLPKTINGGTFIAGNSPGRATTGTIVLGGPADPAGGLSNYTWQINDGGPSVSFPTAPGVSGPSANAANQVSGWGLLVAIQRVSPPPVTNGNMQWDATATDQFTIHVTTLLAPNDANGNPTPGGGYGPTGDSTSGNMSDFDPAKIYTWKLFQYQGTYTGPTDSATLNASTIFDISGFKNTIPAGATFGWVLNQGTKEMDLVYTPVPEPGTLSLVGLAALAAGWRLRKRAAAARSENNVTKS
jgi:hypothetical protein